jgi:hypothetical protein
MNEKLAKKISKTLIKLCPAFSDSNASSAVWHGCKCAATDSSCVCVWHLTSECLGGKWKELAFVDKAKAKKDEMKAKATDAVIKARNA